MRSLEEIKEIKRKVKEHLESYGVEDYITNINMPYSRTVSNHYDDTYQLFSQMLDIQSFEELKRIDEEIKLFFLNDSQDLGIIIFSNILNGASYKKIIYFFDEVVSLAGRLYKYINLANVSLDDEILLIVSLLEDLMTSIHTQAIKNEGETLEMKRQFILVKLKVEKKISEIKGKSQMAFGGQDVALLKKTFRNIIIA